MKQTLYLIIGFLFLACRQQKQLTVSPAPSVKPLIKGGWKEVYKVMPGVKNAYYRWMNFDDSMCTGTMIANQSYYVNHDTLFINRDPKNEFSGSFRFPILKLTKDSLVLFSPYGAFAFKSSRMELARITQQNTIQPAAIYFASGRNYGLSPRMFLEIDADRNFKFFGKFATALKGGFHGTISEADYAVILTLINTLPVDSLQEFYPGNADFQIRGMAIEWNGKLIKSTARGSEKLVLPELTILFDKLMDLYNHTSLQPDSTVTESYFSQHPAAKPTTLLLDENEMFRILTSGK